MKKKIVTCASYGGTGSSAITDFLSEFDEVKCVGTNEFSIAHDVDGISDLEHNLVEDWHRLRNDEAIYRFINLTKRYNKLWADILSIDIDNITRKYINSLVELKWEGYWEQHPLRMPRIKRIIVYRLPFLLKCKCKNIMSKIIDVFDKKKSHKYEYVPYVHRELMYLSRPEETFYEKTKEYFNDILKEMDKENLFKYILLDQVVPTTNISRYIKYFEDIKVVVVDRDPRDLYILNKKYWKEGWIPTDDINIYVKWFKALRRNRENDINNKDSIIFVQFEDLIYNYESEIKKIIKFLDLDVNKHIKKKQIFSPEKSINNTLLWEKTGEFSNEIKIIENELKEYCYRIK